MHSHSIYLNYIILKKQKLFSFIKHNDMMHIQLFLFFSIFLKCSLQLDTVFTNKSVKFIECLIHNEQYSYEYLVNLPNIVDTMTQLNTYPLSLINNFNRIKWLLIRTGYNSSNLFYLKSMTRNEFLCASTDEHVWKKKKRRKIKLVHLDSMIKNDFTCKWSFKKVNKQTTNKYTIWNNYFNESMYASFFVHRFDIYSRYVYLWNEKPDSKQFNWFIDCNKGVFLAS